jgi:hypothetical protein
MRVIAWTSVGVGAVELLIVELHWQPDAAATAWLYFGSGLAILFGTVGVIHLALLRRRRRTDRARVFLSYYWGFPFFEVPITLLAAGGGIASPAMYVAECLQLLSLVLLWRWYRGAQWLCRDVPA